MKKIFYLLLSFMTISCFSQNQTWSGTKTITNTGTLPFKIANVLQNDSNTKLLSLNASNNLQWVDKSTISGAIPDIQSVLNTGSHATGFSQISFGDGTSYANSYNGVLINRTGISVYGSDTNFFGTVRMFSPDYVMDPTIQFIKQTQTPFSYNQINIKVNDISKSVSFELTDNSGKIPSLNTIAPLSSTDNGVVGEIRVTSNYLYVCVATNTWVRTILNTW